MCIMIMLNEYKVKHGFKLNKKKKSKEENVCMLFMQWLHVEDLCFYVTW
jgi:hypothetical protein